MEAAGAAGLQPGAGGVSEKAGTAVRREKNYSMTEARKKWIREQARFRGIFAGGAYPQGMFGRRIPLSSFPVYGEGKAFAEEALEAGPGGRQGERFEEELAEYMGIKYAVAVSSGQAALHLALKLAGERLYGSSSGVAAPGGLGRGGALEGKRVFCPDLTGADMVNPIVFEGGEPVFIDSVDGGGWSMDPEVLELAFAKYPDTGVVVMDHVYGFPGEAAEIRRICRGHGALLVECAGEALGAEYRTGCGVLDGRGGDARAGEAAGGCRTGRAGTGDAGCPEGSAGADVACPSEDAGADRVPGSAWAKAGTLGDYCVLGFGRGKMLGHSGGALLTGDYYSSEKARYWASGARAATLWEQHEELGCGCAMDGLVAAALRGQLLHLDEFMAGKRRIYDRYCEKLDGAMACVIPVLEGTRPSCCITAMTCESNIRFRETRDDRGYTYEDIHGTAAPMEVWEALEAFNVESRPVYKPMSMQPVFRNYEHFTLDGPWRMYEGFRNDMFWQRCDMAKQYYESGICLPCDVGMTREEQDKVMEVVCACYDRADLDRMG